MKLLGLMALLGGVISICLLGAQEGKDIAHVTNILVGQAAGAMVACVGGVMLAH